jgi:hypothetical protein
MDSRDSQNRTFAALDVEQVPVFEVVEMPEQPGTEFEAS